MALKLKGLFREGTGVRDGEARRRWDASWRAMQVRNAILLERELDAQVARTPPWSRAWWKLVAALDRVRSRLIDLGGVGDD